MNDFVLGPLFEECPPNLRALPSTKQLYMYFFWCMNFKEQKGTQINSFLHILHTFAPSGWICEVCVDNRVLLGLLECVEGRKAWKYDDDDDGSNDSLSLSLGHKEN
jgi:hypothetical protein